jgi:hypothetical protein
VGEMTTPSGACSCGGIDAVPHATDHAPDCDVWNESAAVFPELRRALAGDEEALAALDRLEVALCPVVEKYGRVWAKDGAYYAAAEVLGIREPPATCAWEPSEWNDLDSEDAERLTW